MIQVKDGVRFTTIRSQIYSILGILDQTFAEHGYQCIVTCKDEGHGPDDPHTNGFALDLRSHHLPNGAKHAVHVALQERLGNLYTVILEGEGADNEHFHIQIRKDLWRSMLTNGASNVASTTA